MRPNCRVGRYAARDGDTYVHVAATRRREADASYPISAGPPVVEQSVYGHAAAGGRHGAGHLPEERGLAAVSPA